MTFTDVHRDTRRLIARGRSGDRAARELVAERALRVGLRTAMALLGDRERAADVAQEVALTTVARLRDLRDPLAFDAWVHRAAVRESLKMRRRLRRRGEHESSLQTLTAVEAAEASPLDVATRLTIADRLAALPGRQRSAVILRYVHDLSDQDIATALRCRTGTVHALLSRARAALREDPAMRDLALFDQGDHR
jgi:RNA polymerase sigma-70 factor (ECF subfamily)